MFMTIATFRTSLRSVARVNNFVANPFLFCLVQNKGKKLVETPRVQGVSLPLPKRNPLTNAAQILKGNRFALCLGGLHNALGYNMVGVGSEPGLFTVALSEKSFSRLRTFGLKFSSEFQVSIPDVLNSFT
jgi:hypothetical protein